MNTGERIGAFLSQHQANRRVQSFGERSRDALDAFGEFARHPGAIALFVLLFFIAFGSRDLLTDGVPAVGSFARWPGIGDLVSELTSAWRHTGMGSTSAAPPLLGLMSVISTVLFGATGLAETLVVVGAFVVGAWGVFRLARALGTGLGGGSIAAIAYGISAAPRNAVASGRLGALMLYAFAPFIAVLVVRAGRFPGLAGKSIRPLLGLAIATALAAAWYPPAALVGVAIAVGLLLSAVVVGGGGSAIRALGASIVGVAGAAVLLVPWTATLLDVGNDRAAVGIAYHPHLGLSALLRMQSGPNGAGIAGWGLLAAALGSLLVTSGSRLTWATRAWGIAIVGYLAVDLPARLAPNAAVAVPEAGLAVAALGLALAAGLGASGLRERFATKRIGWPQLAGVLAIFGVALASFGFLGDVFDGGWHIPDSWEATLSFTSDQVGKGDFRILWVGDASVLPFDPVAVDQSLAWTTTRNGTGDARELLRAPTTTADDVIGRALQTARAGKTSRLGRMLAPMGIRYVAFAVRNGPDGRRGRSPSGVRASLAAQLDLARLGSSPGLVLYENESWAPAVAVARSGQVPVGTIDPLRSAVGTDLSSARRIGSHPSPAGTVLLAEKYDIGWHANAGGAHLVHGRAFGVTNSFVLNKRGVVTFEHDGKQARTGLVIGEAVLWLVALVWWSRGRRHMGKRTRARTPRDERERRPAFDALALTDDDFWDRA